MKKLLLSTLLGLFLMTGIALTAFASTSSSLDESNYIYSMKNGYGAEFSPPVLQASDDHGVNPSSGYVSVKENLLSLPGKNGFDFNLNLSYVNSTRSKSVQELYNVRVVDAMAFKLLKYDYYQNGVKKSIWGRYRAESDVQETVYASYSQLSSLQSDSSENISPAGRKYFVFSELKEGDVELTLDRSQPAVSEAFPVSTMIEYTAVVNGNTNKTWKVNVPGLEVGQYSLPTRQGSGSFIDETGAVYPYTINIQYGFDPETGVTINSLHKVMSVDIVGSGNREYKTIDTADFGEKKQHALGFEYNTVLQSDAGTQYYFYIDYMGVGTLHAIVDKSGNAITVKKISDQGISYYEFVDSMNRMIRLYSNSVKLVENGQEKEIVRFEEGVEHNPDDPNHILKTDDTYTMKIYRRESEDGDITTTKNITQYNLILKEYDILNRSGNPMVSSPIEARLLDKIIYPTGATRHYEYAEAKSKYGEMVYRVSRAYSKDGETTLHDTTYSYTKDTEKEYPERYAPEYTTTVTVSGGGENVYTYDGYERLISFTNYMTEETETYSYCYSGKYTTDLAFSMRPLEQSYNDSGILTRYQYENGWPTRTEKTGEPIVLNTYDDRYMQVTRSEALRDNTHWVITENTLSEDGRYIVSSQVSEDDIVQSKTMYQYDSYGNIIEEKVTDSDGSVLSLTKYAYTYNNDGSYKVESWTENVKDADGAVTQKIGTVKNYDRRGRLVQETDANGNQIKYFYDSLGRLVRTQNSDETESSLEYDTQNNTILATDENGNQIKHSYTGFGLYEKVEVKKDGTWATVYEYEYDSLGRKTGETEYRGSDGADITQYSAAYALDQRGRVTNQTITDSSNTVVSEADYAYEDYLVEPAAKLYDMEPVSGGSNMEKESDSECVVINYSSVSFDLNQQYTAFEAVIDGEYKAYQNKIRVYGDDVLLYEGELIEKGEPVNVFVNVMGVDILRIECYRKNWYDAKLYSTVKQLDKITMEPQGETGQNLPEIVQYTDNSGK